MARPRRSQATKLTLLEEGVSAFLEQGYHGAGLKEVLDRAQVPKGSFYNYFASKEEFAAAAVRHYADCFVAKMDDVMGDSPDPLAGIRRFFETLTADFEAANYTGGCLIGNLGGELEGSDLCRKALVEGWDSWRDRLEEAIGEAQAAGQIRKDLTARELADTLTDSWEGAVLRMKVQRSADPLRRVIERLLDDYFQA